MPQVFKLLEERAKGKDYTVRVSLIEIYNETVRDLLANKSAPHSHEPRPSDKGRSPGGAPPIDALQRKARAPRCAAHASRARTARTYVRD
jgi:hypothetical protein